MKKKLCPMGDCESCVWFQPWNIEERDAHGGKTGRVRQIEACSLQVLLETIPKIHGSIDGLQEAVNDSRNRSMETKTRVEDFGNAVYNVVKNQVKLVK